MSWVARRHRFGNSMEIQRVRGTFGEAIATDIHIGLSSVGRRPGYCLVFFGGYGTQTGDQPANMLAQGLRRRKIGRCSDCHLSSIPLSKFHFFQNRGMWAWDFGGPSWRPVGTSMLR